MNKNNKIVKILICLLLIVSPQIIIGADTNSGVIVSNSTTLDYQVSTFPQAKLFSNSDRFVVDNKVDLIVTTIDMNKIPAKIATSPNVLTYLVINKGNTPQDYSLKAVGLTGSSFEVNDDISQNNVRVFVDENFNGIYEKGIDNNAYIDELDENSSVYVFIVSDVKLSTIELDSMAYNLVVQTAKGGELGVKGANITNDDNGNVSPGGKANNIPNNLGQIEVVFADGSGILDRVYDGQFSSRNVFDVSYAIQEAANISLASSALISNQKAIPGATITYTIDITNSGPVDATSVVLVDQIPLYTTFASTSITTANSNIDASVDVEYSSDGITWSKTEAAQVAYLRVTFSVVNANDGNNNGTAQLTFNVTID